MKFLPFEDARKFVRNLKLKNQVEWNQYLKSGKKPEYIPYKPERVYHGEWINLGDWLGTGWLVFDEARSLSSGDYNGDGKDDLAIGVPQEDVDLEIGTLENFDNKIDSSVIAADTGVVQIIYGSGNGLSTTAVLPDQVLRQGFANIEELSEGGDFFGYSS